MGRRGRRLEGPNGEIWRLKLEANAGPLGEGVAEGALIFANNGYGDYLFLVPDSKAVKVYWHEGPQVADYTASVEDLLPDQRRPPTTHPPIKYRDSGDVVMLGDAVQVRYWLLFSGRGRITYVPGVSPHNRQLERDGLAWVRVALDAGGLVDFVVMPDGALQKSVVLLSRV